MTASPERLARVEGHGCDYRIVIAGDVYGKTWQFQPSARADCDKVNAAFSQAVQERCNKLIVALAQIRDWRKDCHDYDEDMGHPKRDFDVDDVVAMEDYARKALEEFRGR